VRRAGVARKRSITPRWRSWIIPIPLQVPWKKAVMITTAGARKSTYDVVSNPGRSTMRLKSWL
jgi:hypothetical protein